MEGDEELERDQQLGLEERWPGSPPLFNCLNQRIIIIKRL